MRAQGDLEGAKEAYQSSLAIAERLASFIPVTRSFSAIDPRRSQRSRR